METKRTIFSTRRFSWFSLQANQWFLFTKSHQSWVGSERTWWKCCHLASTLTTCDGGCWSLSGRWGSWGWPAWRLPGGCHPIRPTPRRRLRKPRRAWPRWHGWTGEGWQPEVEKMKKCWLKIRGAGVEWRWMLQLQVTIKYTPGLFFQRLRGRHLQPKAAPCWVLRANAEFISNFTSFFHNSY